MCVRVGFQRQFLPLMLIHKDEWMNGRMDDVFDFTTITAAVPFVMFDADILMLHSTLEQFTHQNSITVITNCVICFKGWYN